MKSRSIALTIGAAGLFIGFGSLAQGEGDRASPLVSREAEQRGDLRRDADGNIYEIRRDAYGRPVEIRPADPNFPVQPPNPNHTQNFDPRTRLSAGGYIPREYTGRQNIVRNWGRQRLQPPPPGHQWLRIDNEQFALVDKNTGVIRQVVVGPRR